MSVDDLTIDINIEGDGGKKIDAIIGKIKNLNVAVGQLNKSLKGTDSGLNIKGPSIGSTSSSTVKTPKEKTELQLRTESLRMSRIELGEKRVAIASQKIKETQDKKEEKEEDRRRKERDKDAKKFFGTIQSGFRDTAKIALGALGTSTSIVGLGIASASQAQGIASAGSQQGINSQSLQRWRNVLTQAGGIGSEEATQEIVNLQAKLNQNQYTGELIQPLSQLNLPADTKDVFALYEALRNKSGNLAPGIRTGLFGQLGISPGAVNAFNPETFSNEKFEKAYNLPILSEEIIGSNKDLVIALDKLRIVFGTVIGKLLGKISPNIGDLADTLSGADTPDKKQKFENIKTSAEKYAVVGGLLGIPLGPIGVGAGAVLGAGYGALSNPLGNQSNWNLFNIKRTSGQKNNEDDFGKPFFKIRRTKDNSEFITPQFDDLGAQNNVPMPSIAEAARMSQITHTDNSQVNINVDYQGNTKEDSDRFARIVGSVYTQNKQASQYDSKPKGH